MLVCGFAWKTVKLSPSGEPQSFLISASDQRAVDAFFEQKRGCHPPPDPESKASPEWTLSAAAASTRAHPRFRTQNRRQGGEDPFREAPRGTLIRDLVGTGLPLLPAGPQVTTSLTSPPSGEDKICASPRFLYNEINSGRTGLGRDYPDRIYRSKSVPTNKDRNLN